MIKFHTMCSRSELQPLLTDFRSQLGELSDTCRQLRTSHAEMFDDQRKSSDCRRLLDNKVKHMHEDLSSLREEHQALRDCLALSGVVTAAEVAHRLSLRRATQMLKVVLEIPELSILLGECSGILTARRLRCVSRGHGGSMSNSIPALERKLPPDVYVFGGKNDMSLALATAERYSPRTGEWVELPPMRAPRYGCAAAALGGRLYVVGGHDGKQVLAAAECFDPHCGHWSPLTPMPTARSRCAAAAMNGQLYVIGGRDSRTQVTAAERFEPKEGREGRWEALPPMPLAPMGCTAAATRSGLYVVGVGQDREMAVECFDTGTFSWNSVPHVPKQRFGCAATEVQGALYVVGGHDGEQAIAVCERLCVQRLASSYRNVFGGVVWRNRSRSATDNSAVIGWQQVPSLPTPRHGCAATCAGGVLYVFGGDDGKDGRSLTTAECFDPATGRWGTLPPASTGRFGCAAASAWK
eukprot:TRINITY_DN67833_c0_g1_i1.p1 TRINITY_DN67833_c0_g1~~TRINITY_DN67833_c0_g1_i1.p1  ORF type:complete len:467 (-),score=66.16 TRINITY_DN67833_c0_g1_i1:236-1636(-)